MKRLVLALRLLARNWEAGESRVLLVAALAGALSQANATPAVAAPPALVSELPAPPWIVPAEIVAAPMVWVVVPRSEGVRVIDELVPTTLPFT